LVPWSRPDCRLDRKRRGGCTGESSVRYGVRIGTMELSVDAPFRSGDELYAVDRAVSVFVAETSIRWLSA
jgi:hypothetical protein